MKYAEPSKPAAVRGHADAPGGGVSPQRVRLRRTQGFRLPPDTVVVSRPSRWGNPFRAARNAEERAREGFVADRATAVACHDEWLTTQARHLWPEIREKLGGKNLACWCPLDGPCHADTLLRIANPHRNL